MSTNLSETPRDLPAPVDDGAAAHLKGWVLPERWASATVPTIVTERALVRDSYTQLEQPTRVIEDEVLKLRAIGPKALDQLRRALAEKGLSFADTSGK